MTTSLQEQSRDSLKFIWLGYNDMETNFLVRFHRTDFDTLKRAITAVGSYNEFNGRKVAQAFAKIESLARYASFGREGSPVLYIELDSFEKTPEQITEICRDIIGTFQVTKFDEQAVYQQTVVSNSCNPQANGRSTPIVRLWWD